MIRTITNTPPTFGSTDMHHAVVEAMRLVAVAAKSPYPQYAGHFDTWVICVVEEDVEFKGSSTLAAHEIVLAEPVPTLTLGVPVTRSTFCPSTGNVVACPWESIRPIITEED